MKLKRGFTMSNWHRTGKQVLQDGKHFADAAGEFEAMMIVNAMRGLEDRPLVPYVYGASPESPMRGTIVHHIPPAAVRRPRLNLNTCRVMRQGDEMSCECGLRWAVDDPEPPLCVHRAPRA